MEIVSSNALVQTSSRMNFLSGCSPVSETTLTPSVPPTWTLGGEKWPNIPWHYKTIFPSRRRPGEFRHICTTKCVSTWGRCWTLMWSDHQTALGHPMLSWCASPMENWDFVLIWDGSSSAQWLMPTISQGSTRLWTHLQELSTSLRWI